MKGHTINRLRFYQAVTLLLLWVLCAVGLTLYLDSRLAAPTAIIPMEMGRPDLPPLAQMIDSAENDAAALILILDYYEAHRQQLAERWQLADETALRAVFAMYLVHISIPYGESGGADGLVAFSRLEYAHCGIYPQAQAILATALGLRWRWLALESGTHGWLEIWLDERWQVFDATVNVWIDAPMSALLEGASRQYRAFYSPLADPTRPDARQHTAQSYDALALRRNLPYWPQGLSNRALIVIAESSEG